MMILFNNGSGELGANPAFAFLADGENVNCLHGKREKERGACAPLC